MAKYKMPAMLPLCLAVLVGQNAMALGLGPASLDSELGEPLFARVPIFRADGLGSEQLLVTLSPVKDGESGIDVGTVDTRAISAVGEVDLTGNGTIYLRSDRPLVEPFLHFMLTVRWPNGSLSRAYTLLFDPPANTVSSAASGVSALQNINRNSTGAIASRSEPRQSRPVRAAEVITAESSLYTTVRGDSLWSIALRLAKVKSGSVNLWMDRLYANNPKAFIRGNRNLLKERMTLDLFESIPEPLDTDPQAMPAAKPKLKKTEIIATSSVGGPSDLLAQDKVILNRREDEINNTAAIGDSDGVLTEKQFLQQSLGSVRSEVDQVSKNISAMTDRLAALQAQLDSLNSQYRQLQTVEIETNAVIPANSDAPTNVEQEQSEVTTAIVEAPADGELINKSPQVDELPLIAATETRAQAPVVKSATAESSSGTWRWLLPLAALGLALLFWVRRRREAKDAAFNVDLGDVNAAVAARANTKEAFNDVFTSLDSQASVVLKPSPNPFAEAPSREETNESDVFDVAPPESKPVDDIAQVNATIDEDLIAALNHASDDTAEEHTDQLFLDSSDIEDGTRIEEIELDDELFANLEDDETEAPVLKDSELVDFDLSAIDDDWLGDSKDDALHGADGLDSDGDAHHRAAAAIELGDLAGAKIILESAILVDDDIDLKVQLLDVLARSGDSDGFEAVALQLEFAEVDDEVMREVDILRALLDGGGQGNGKRHAE